jgi:hypothetical protein
MPAPRQRARLARHRLRLLVERWPLAYYGLQQLRRRWRTVAFAPITAETDLVISGYPSVGNSFARVATAHANPGIRIASHGHSPAEVAYAARRGLPTLLLLREPVEAVASRRSRFAHLSTVQMLEEYARYYERVRRFAGHTVVADFAEVTDRFGDVLRRVNARFGTALVPFDHDDPAAVRAVLEQIGEQNRQLLGEQASREGATPSAERAGSKSAATAELAAPEVRALVQRCRQAYEALLP